MNKILLGNIDEININDMKQISVDNCNYLVANINGEIFVTDDLCFYEVEVLNIVFLLCISVNFRLKGCYFYI